MVIGVLTVDLYIPLCQSLKEKRRPLNALKTKLSAAFNVSVAEVDEQDSWQKSVRTFVHVGLKPACGEFGDVASSGQKRKFY